MTSIVQSDFMLAADVRPHSRVGPPPTPVLTTLGASVAHGAMFLETKGGRSDLVGERLGSSSSRVQAQDSRPLMEVLRK